MVLEESKYLPTGTPVGESACLHLVNAFLISLQYAFAFVVKVQRCSARGFCFDVVPVQVFMMMSVGAQK